MSQVIPTSFTITDTKVFIDGVAFPHFIAEEGPTVEVRTEFVTVVHVPILVFSDQTMFADLRRTGPELLPPEESK